MTDAQPTVGIITVGDELLTGRVVDRHSAAIAARLTPLGYHVVFHVSVGDACGDLARHLEFVHLEEPDVVFVTGGLGPTADDRTRAEVAAALGVDLEFREAEWQGIVDFMDARGVRANESNRHQAYFPVGATAVDNPLGTAPAFYIERGEGPNGRRRWWVLPGVPVELSGLLENTVLPALLEDLPVADRGDEQVLRFFDVSESRLDAWFASRLGVSTEDYHIRVSQAELEVHLPSGTELLGEVKQHFLKAFVGLGSKTLAQRVIEEGAAAGATVAVAESCTGGQVASRLTDVPGASSVFTHGWVVYANEAKSGQLGVPKESLERHGAVSAEVAEALAAGARERAASDYAVSITGIAGPDGGSSEKPVGTVYFGYCGPNGVGSELRRFHGNREQIRERSASYALSVLLRSLRHGA